MSLHKNENLVVSGAVDANHLFSIQINAHRVPEKDRYKTDAWMHHDDAGFDVDEIKLVKLSDDQIQVTGPKIKGSITLSTEVLKQLNEKFISQLGN